MAQQVTLKIQETLTAKILLLCDNPYLITFTILCTPHFAHSAVLTFGQQPNRGFQGLRKDPLNFFYRLLFE